MLVLSRKKDESIVIDNDIKVVIIDIKGNRIRLGIEAPREVPVKRGELQPPPTPKRVDVTPPNRVKP